MIADMQRVIPASTAFRWIDLESPTQSELEALFTEHKINPLAVQDVLEPEHLPKFEDLDGVYFLILRVYDLDCAADSATAEELTRKIAFLVREGLLITVHRAPLPFLERFIDEIKSKSPSGKTAYSILIEICTRAISTLEKPLEMAERGLERLEAQVARDEILPNSLLEFHLIRRRLSAFKHLLWHTSTGLQRLSLPKGSTQGLLTHLRETVDRLLFFSDELLEDATSLMNLMFSLSSQKTSEVMRVLTVFSVFFMPLTFIVGIYGMNFENQPEFRWIYGYPFVWGVMGFVTIGIAVWFKKKGWL
jgi:magnesium transporter